MGVVVVAVVIVLKDIQNLDRAQVDKQALRSVIATDHFRMLVVGWQAFVRMKQQHQQ